MRHQRRMLDQALHAAQAFGQREHFARLEKTPRTVNVRVQIDRDNAAETAMHLVARQCMLRMRFQPRIVHLADLRLLLEPVRQQ